MEMNGFECAFQKAKESASASTERRIFLESAFWQLIEGARAEKQLFSSLHDFVCEEIVRILQVETEEDRKKLPGEPGLVWNRVLLQDIRDNISRKIRSFSP